MSACAAARVPVLQGMRGYYEGKLDSYCDGSRRVFAFIREPLSHFISGWAEYTSRSAAWKDAHSNAVRSVTEHETEAFLEALVAGRTRGTDSKTHPLYHMAPMSGIRMQRFGMPQYAPILDALALPLRDLLPRCSPVLSSHQLLNNVSPSFRYSLYTTGTSGASSTQRRIGGPSSLGRRLRAARCKRTRRPTQTRATRRARDSRCALSSGVATTFGGQSAY